ncbi:MAG: glutamine-hydrolyzing carbamoyl-phosphate synthase small subunit [Acidimicrobiia bacterium]|nr:glutamine-hydrolyzing carbamoyl-phosphate synthase small subunit [Acidimicrobiia bacterium]
MKRGLLATADGALFRGVAAGADGVAVGEAVFNTSMTGYQEIITDPSYAGQVVVLTSPHVGNYGATAHDDQADVVHARALVIRSLSRRSSSWRADQPFDDYLISRGIVALSDIDTRRLTRHIRDRGAMPVAVGSDVDEAELVALAAAAPSMSGQDLVSSVTTTEPYFSAATRERVGSVVAYDFGIKRDIVTSLNLRGLDVTVVPATMTADETLARHPDGVFLANGPGDPEPLTESIGAVRGLLGKTPIFGICLGHQILGLALGASTFKLPFGHHGGNHPVRNLIDGTVDITAHNHGFSLDLGPLAGTSRPVTMGKPDPSPGSLTMPRQRSTIVDTPYGAIRPTHQNLNDGTNEGLACLDIRAFSVQYHPEAAPGPNDAEGLFDRFVEAIEANRA